MFPCGGRLSIRRGGFFSGARIANLAPFGDAVAVYAEVGVGGAGGRSVPAATAPPHDQPLLLGEAEQALVVHHVALPAQQDVQASVAKASALVGQRLHPLAQRPERQARRAWITRAWSLASRPALFVSRAPDRQG